jgi:hypothetical protein
MRKFFLPKRVHPKGNKEPFCLPSMAEWGLTGYQQTVNSPMTLRAASVNTDNKYMTEANKNLQVQTNNATNNVSEMEHDQPVSFGITVSKYLFDDLSVETGLVYSYLHSKSRNTNDNFKVQEVQKFIIWVSR